MLSNGRQTQTPERVKFAFNKALSCETKRHLFKFYLNTEWSAEDVVEGGEM